MSSSSTSDPGATSFAWRLANALAIASPYLLAAGMYLTLYFTRPTPPPAAAFIPAAPAASPDNGSSVFADAGAPAAAPAKDQPPAAPQPAAEPEPRAPARTKTVAPSPAVSRAASASQAAAERPVVVDPAVASTLKLSGAPPTYPAIAQAAHVEGTVVLALTVTAGGAVEDVRVVSGPPLLQAGAVSAVRSWQYRPWLVYGKPVPFTTQLSIDFKINPAH